MRYAKDRKEQTRRNIMRSAVKLFVAKGFKATSIDEIMRDCRLTRGGFYAHFLSKSQLYRHAMTLAAQSSSRRRTTAKEPLAGMWVDQLVDEYIHTDERAFFATDVANSDPEVRAAYASACDALRARIAAHGNFEEEVVLSAAAMLVGAVGIARTVDDPKMKSKLAAACKQGVSSLLDGGTRPSFFWEPPTRVHQFARRRGN